MEPNHIINRLTLELDTELSRAEVDLLRSKIPDAIDYCFNKYYPYSKTLQIEEITLDLGTIERINLHEEYIVRLSYLLDTELRKLLQKEGVDELIDQQNIYNDLELFIYFLKTGMMISGSDTIKILFQRLIKNDLQSLKFNLKNIFDDKTVKERFFHQLKEDQLDEYWLAVEPIIFLEIRQFNYKIQKATWGKRNFKFFKNELKDYLRRVTFEFMMNDNKLISLDDYIKFLKLNFNKSQGLIEDIKVFVSQLIIKLINENEFQKSFKPTSSVKHLIDELTTYIVEEGTAPLSVVQKQIIRNTFSRSEIQEIVLKLIKSSFNVKKFTYALERIYQVLNPRQIELFFQILQRENKFSFQKELIELSDIIQLTRSILLITPYDLGPLWVGDVIKEVKQQFKKQPISLFALIDQVSLRTGYGRDYIIEKMIKSDGSNMAKSILKTYRLEVRKIFNRDVTDSSLIDTYLYYLKSGIWNLGDQSPDDVLKTLLRDSIEPLILALKREEKDKVVWLRLIHCHELFLVEKLIMAFFHGIKRKRKFERIIRVVNLYNSDVSLKKRIFERLIADLSWFDDLPDSDKGFNINLIREELDSFFRYQQYIKDLSLVPLIDYLDQGKLEFHYSITEILKMAKRLIKKDLIELSMMISFGNNSNQNKQKLKRIFEIFSFAQIDILFVAFARQETKKRKAFENFQYLKTFLQTLFSENIYHYGYQQIASFINHFSISESQLNNSLHDLLERVALKKDIVFTELLSTIITSLDPGEYPKLIALRRQLIQSLVILEKKKEKSLEMIDDLFLLLNYLESGVWLSVDLDPISSFNKALENDFDKLILEFEKRVTNQIFWLRLLYQFDFDIVLKIILNSFKRTAEFGVLEKYLPELDRQNQPFGFKLLETFILVKIDIDKDESFEELFEYHLKLFQKKESEMDSVKVDVEIDEVKIFNDFNLLLTAFFDKPTTSQADLVWLRFNSEVGNYMILNNLFINGQYSWTIWERLFKRGSKVDLITLLNISLSINIQNSWEIKLFHFFGTNSRFSIFNKSTILDFLKALFFKNRYSLKNIFSEAWKSLLNKRSKRTTNWLKDKLFNEFISLLNVYDLISKYPHFKFTVMDLMKLEKDVLFSLMGQMDYFIEEMRPLVSSWILNIIPIATTKRELTELLYLKLFSVVISHDVINLNELIWKVSPDIRLFVFTQIINSDITETNQIIYQQKLLYGFLQKLIEDQSLSAQLFLNIDKKKLTQFLSLLPDQMLLKLMIIFNENINEEAQLLNLIREIREISSRLKIELSPENRDTALLRIVIDKMGITNTPFKSWTSFETFFKGLLTNNLLKIKFFKEFDLNTVRQFFALLSPETLIQLQGFFDENKDDEVLFLDSIRELKEISSKSEIKISPDVKDLALLGIVIDTGEIKDTSFKSWTSFETFFKGLLTNNLLKIKFFKEFDLNTVYQFFALLSPETLTQLLGFFDENKDDEVLFLDSIRELQEISLKSEIKISPDVKDLALLSIVIDTGEIKDTSFKNWASFEALFKDLLIKGVLTVGFFKKFKSSNLSIFYKLISSNLLLSIQSLFGSDNVMFSPLYLLKDSDEGIKFQKEFLNLNDLDDLHLVSSFDVYPHRSFGILLEKIIELGFKKAATQYKNFQEFEVEFNRQLSIQNDIWQILAQRSIAKMKTFLGFFKQVTLDNLIKLIDYKFGGILISESMIHIKKANQKLLIELDVSIIIFGFSHDHFDQESLLQFLDDQIDSLIIPHEMAIILMKPKNDGINLFYVESFIIYLKERKKINEGIFVFEVEEALNRILHFKREFFISQLKRESDIEQVLISLFERLPQKVIPQYFNQLMPAYAGQWELVWRSIPYSVSKVAFTVKWILLGFRNRQKIEFKTLSTFLMMQLTKRKLVSAPKLSLSKTNKAEYSLIRVLSNASIKDSYLAHFDIYDFVEEVITTGTFPSWSIVYSVERFFEILVKLAKVDGHHFKSNIDAFLKKVSNIDLLISFFGEKKFILLYNVIRPSAYFQAQKITDQFEQAFAAVLKNSGLTNYFALIILRYQHKYPTANIEQIWDEMLNQLSLSMNVSKIELIDLAGTQGSERISAYLESIKLNTITYTNKQLAWQGDIDFLLHLILHNEYPWWSIEFDDQGLSKSENLIRLTNKMLHEHPKSFIEAVSILNRADDVFVKVIPIIKPQIVDRILLILSPQHGAFVINFNILIKRWGYLKAKNEWITFLFRYFSHLESFNHDQFIASSVGFIMKKTTLGFQKIKVQLLKITSDALHEGEMKFLPFMNLLNDLDINEQVSPLPNTYSVKYHPSRNFISVITYYIVNGSLPVDYAFLIKSYLAFIRKIESYLNSGHEEVRFAIISVMKSTEVRARVVKNEKEDILFLITRALFPKESKLLMEYKSDIVKLFTHVWPSIRPKMINELFYQTIYQSVLNTKFMNLTALDLVNLYLQQFRKRNQMSFDFDMNNYDYLNISDKLMEIVVSLNTSEKVRDTSNENDSEAKPLPITLDLLDQIESDKLEYRIEIKNAGIVIVWPYLDKFFQMLEMTEKGAFKTEADAIRAVHLIQYLVTGSNETPEYELPLNKILCGINFSIPVPLQIELTDIEKETSDLMLNGVIQNWQKLKSSSIYAMREGFFIRQGFLEEKKDFWELEVEKKTIDILLKSLPWGFGTVKLPWMSKRLIVNWT